MNVVDGLILADEKSPRTILVVGDAMVDVYVHGKMNKCQEGCVKFTQESQVAVPGGAANAARSLEHWKSEVVIVEGAGGPVKTRFMDGCRCVFRHDDERADPNLKQVREASLFILVNSPPNAVLLSDYDKGALTPEFIREVVDLCSLSGTPCVVDAKREPSLYEGAILKGNSDYRTKHADQIPFSANAVITYGGNNPILWDGGACHGTGVDLPSVYCVNHVGAGDCFAAHLALALAHGLSLVDSAAVAHCAGRVYVRHPHNRPPRPHEIAADMARAAHS